MSKTVPNFLFPTNFRNGKNVKRLVKDFNVQGYGIAVYLLETLAETEEHKFPFSDIDLLADEMKVSIPVIKTVIESYELFEIIEDEKGIIFISSQLNKWLEPYYIKIEKLSRAGKISSLKKKQKQEQQLLELSSFDSTKHVLNKCTTINKLINKSKKVKEMNENEKYEDLNQKLLIKQLNKDIKIEKLENLAISKENEILI